MEHGPDFIYSTNRLTSDLKLGFCFEGPLSA